MNQFEDRKFIILSIFLLIGVVFTFRLFYIQVIDDSYTLHANNQALRREIIYPTRGLIYDRNGKLLVYNEAAYDLMVVPREVKDLDTLALCELIGITKEKFLEKYSKAKKFSRYKASIFEEQIPADQFSIISEKLYKFQGFYGQKRTLRRYPYSNSAHLLGYIGEVSARTLENDNYYRKGDYIGKSGLELQYEKELRGERGIKLTMVDVHNISKGSYREGKYDTLAIAGKDIKITIDAKLQNYGEQLMQNKKGSLVAIDPKTGEILSLVSVPNYDPNSLSGRDRSKNYVALTKNDSLDPLFNRALMAPYPPGSIYKMIQALIGLQEGVISPSTSLPCVKSLVGCHNHPAPDKLSKAIQFSCNPYFYRAFERIMQQGKSNNLFKDAEIGLNNWHNHMLSFGLGKRLPIDFPSVKGGFIPDSKFYDKWYGNNRWAFSTIYSISIGQGEVSVIPLQMANLAVIIANRGYYYTPHLIKEIDGNDSIPEIFKEQLKTTVDKKHFDVVVEAMQEVVDAPHGTARRARIDSIEVCGKTGTVENPHGEDHSVFIAFAPKNDPKIALAVYVENAGFGGTWAAPIASLMIEKYLTDTIKDKQKEERIIKADFINGINIK